ncbi:MAG: DNA damage-inducible protein D [Ktedonobacteraceae bacterium]
MSQHFHFESLKYIDQYGEERWSARELQSLLGYTKWERFNDTIKCAIISCRTSGNDVERCFSSATKTSPKGDAKEIEDYALNRLACYLVIQNGDVRKKEIATAQNYFAFTAEIYDMQQTQLQKAQYLLLSIKATNETEICDVTSSENLAIKLFHFTASEAKLKREQVADENTAILTHHDVGQEVRHAVENIHKKKPEDLPRAASIRKLVEEKRRKARKQLKNTPPDEQDSLF